ncbi:MAG: response regulator [Planctomycetota bacterium]
MSESKTLMTGDYWHHDFKDVISNASFPVTMVSAQRLEKLDGESFGFIIIAQSRPNQFNQSLVDRLMIQFPNTPIFNLLGSWCEGETRTGTPLTGVKRVYWHQWKGQFLLMQKEINSGGIVDSFVAPTANVADRIRAPKSKAEFTGISTIGVSAWTKEPFDMLADAFGEAGWKSRWVERTMWDGQASSLLSVLCVDANGWTFELQQRLKWLRSEFPGLPVVLLLNFPRSEEKEEIISHGVSEVVSKPFELETLHQAIQTVCENVNELV